MKELRLTNSSFLVTFSGNKTHRTQPQPKQIPIVDWLHSMFWSQNQNHKQSKEGKHWTMKNAMGMVFLARRILTKANCPASKLRYYSSPPSSPPPNNKLFVGGLSLSLSLQTHTTLVTITQCPSAFCYAYIYL